MNYYIKLSKYFFVTKIHVDPTSVVGNPVARQMRNAAVSSTKLSAPAHLAMREMLDLIVVLPEMADL